MDLTFLGSERKSMPPSFPHLAQTRAYWEALRRDGRLPRREEIDPRLVRAPITQGVGTPRFVKPPLGQHETGELRKI